MKKIPPRSFRLGFGEFEDAAGEQSHYDARRRLLNAIHSVKPQVLEELAGEPLAAYQSAVASFGRQGMPYDWESLVIDAEAEEWGEIFVPLRDALDKWLRRWNLRQCEPWCSAVTLQTLDTWGRSQSWLESRQWAHAHAGFIATRAEERAFRFEHEGWNPNSDTWKEGEQAIRNSFERELSAYRARIDALAAERGFVSTKEKRKGDGFEWLARVIVDACSCSAIARELSLTERAVQIAVHEAADQAGVAVEYPRNWRLSS